MRKPDCDRKRTQQQIQRPAAPPFSREKPWGFRCCVVHGNMAANIRGRTIRSLRMRGKPLKLDSAVSLQALRWTNKTCPTWNNPCMVPHHVCCLWQVGMTVGKRMYRWIWPEVSRGFFTSPWKRLLFKMDVKLQRVAPWIYFPFGRCIFSNITVIISTLFPIQFRPITLFAISR